MLLKSLVASHKTILVIGAALVINAAIRLLGREGAGISL